MKKTYLNVSPNFAELMFKILDSNKFFCHQISSHYFAYVYLCKCTENHGKGSTTHLPHHLIHRSVNLPREMKPL